MSFCALWAPAHAEQKWDMPLAYPAANFHSVNATAFGECIKSATAGDISIATHPGERVAIACHGGVINAYIGHIIASKFDMFFRPAHTSVSIVGAAEGIRALYSLNDIAHLRTPEDDFHSL